MITDLGKVRLYVCPGSTDMRKAMNGLSGLIYNQIKTNPYNGDLYLFLSKNKKNLKILYWNKNGFCLWQKKLEKDKFPWPDSDIAKWEITPDEFRMLLQGIDFFHPHKEIKINFG